MKWSCEKCFEKGGISGGLGCFHDQPEKPLEGKCKACDGSGIVSVPPKDWRNGADYEVAKCLNCQSK